LNADEPAIGSSIRTSDGHTLGVVRRTLGDYFQVDEDGRGVWYPTAALDRDHRTVGFTAGDRVARSVPPPDAYEENPYIEPATRTAEQQEQRDEMLADLAEQRAEFDERGALPDADRSIGQPVEDELSGEPDAEQRD
jgi:hypothetical protein